MFRPGEPAKVDDDAAKEKVKAAIRQLIEKNPLSKEFILQMEPNLLAGVIVRHTAHTTVSKDDDDYDSDADDFDENHEASLPSPTADATVDALVKSDSADEVVLWRGATGAGAAAIVSASSAGGDPADTAVARLDDVTRRQQIAKGGIAPEFTASQAVQGFQRDNWLVVIRISAKYLVRGSRDESGWIAAHSAPVTVLAVVDRTQGKKPTGKFRGANASQ